MNRELYHHGVKGMRWGVRKDRSKGGVSSAGSSRRESLAKNAKRGAAVAGTALALYGAHKLINNPQAIGTGKSVIAKAMQHGSKIKSNVEASTEYKIAKGIVKGAKKAGSAVSSDKFVKAVTGVGAMAGTAQLLRTQIKDLKNIDKNSFDGLDRALNTTKKVSEIGESVSKLSKGPMGQNSKISGSDSNLLKKTRDLKKEIGDPRGMHGAEDEKAYQALFKRNPSDDQRALIKAMRKNGYSVEQMEQYVFHGDYMRNELYHYGVKGMKWGQRRYETASGHLTPAGAARYAGGKVSGAAKKVGSHASNAASYGVKGNAHRLAAANYGLNNKFYGGGNSASKARNTMASMNRSAQKQSLKKAEQARTDHLNRRENKLQAKADRKIEKRAIKDTTKDLMSQRTRKDKLIGYNKATYKDAAKRIVKNNTPVDEALKKSKRKALRNTAVVMGAYGAYTYAQIKKMNG